LIPVPSKSMAGGLLRNVCGALPGAGTKIAKHGVDA